MSRKRSYGQGGETNRVVSWPRERSAGGSPPCAGRERSRGPRGLRGRGCAPRPRREQASRSPHLFNQAYFWFNPAGDCVLTVDARSNPTCMEFDPRGCQRQVKNAVGAVSYPVFDPEGQRGRSTFSAGGGAADLTGRFVNRRADLAHSVAGRDEAGDDGATEAQQGGETESNRAASPPGSTAGIPQPCAGRGREGVVRSSWGQADRAGGRGRRGRGPRPRSRREQGLPLAPGKRSRTSGPALCFRRFQ